MPVLEIPIELQSGYDAKAGARDVYGVVNRTSERVLLVLVEQYHDFWKLGTVTMEQMQQILDLMTPAAYIPILQTAAEWFADVKADFGDKWDAGRYDKYLSGPYTYTVNQQTMQLTLTGVTQAWAYQPEVVPVEGGE